VTGAGGFIGSNLVEVLASAGFFVRAVYRSSPASDLPSHRLIERLVLGGFERADVAAPAFRGVDSVIHCAACAHGVKSAHVRGATSRFSDNVLATEFVARQAAQAGVKKFIFLSSVGVLGRSTPDGGPFTDAVIPSPHDDYSESKRASEIFLKDFCRAMGMRLYVFRLPMVYGRFAKGSFAHLLSLIRSGVPLPIGSINNRRSFLSVGNLSEFIVKSVSSEAADGEYLLSDGWDLSTPDFVSVIGRAVGIRPLIVRCPVGLLRVGGSLLGRSSAIEKLVVSLQVDSSRAFGAFGWTPTLSADECVARAVG
jgi:UDP-glucose 4-epimerase